MAYLEQVATTSVAGSVIVGSNISVTPDGIISVAAPGSGPTGPTGGNGTNGSTGIQGQTGPTGAKGIAGTTGATGSNGTNGSVGATGSTGAGGTTGPTGVNGTNGTTGFTGPTGVQGSNGTTGATGSAGIQGQTGPTGAIGSTGPTGTQGKTGPTGGNGTNGNNGPTGPTGAQGSSGTNGNSGSTGPTGVNGITGPTGAAGTNGSWSYGSFCDTTTQTNQGITSANTVVFNTTSLNSGILVVSNSQITFANAGVYLLNFNGQLQGVGNSTAANIWISQNGTNVTNSNNQIYGSKFASAAQQVFGDWLITAAANDVVRVLWSSTDITVQFVPSAAGTLPTTPVSPSVKLIVTPA